VKIGDGKIPEAIGIGDVQTIEGIMEVVYLPSLETNLFSVSSATDNGNGLKFMSKYVSIFRNGKETLIGARDHGI